MSKVCRRRRGVSEVLGAILIAVMVMGMSTAYALWAGQSSQRQALSIADVIRAAERRQRQLLSLTYAYKDESGNLHLFIYNYGSETSTPDKLYVNGTLYTMGSGSYTFNMKKAGANDPVSCIDPKNLVELTATLVPSSSQYDVILTTAEGGIFIWKINVQ